VKIGDLVKFKANCRPHWYRAVLRPRVLLIDRISGGFVGLHGLREHGLIAKANFDLVRSINENR